MIEKISPRAGFELGPLDKIQDTRIFITNFRPT